MLAKKCAQNDSEFQRLQGNNKMLGWICGVKAKDGTWSEDFLVKLHFFDVTAELRTRCLSWFGYVKHSDDLSSVMNLTLLGKRGRGRLLKTFEACVKDDIKL